MNISNLDWAIIGVYFVVMIAVAAVYTRRAGGNTREFFLSGRNLPWWIAGTTMVATTFAADTPLAVTELVARNGIAGNWLWWNMLFGGMLTVFFFSRLWRRAEIMTDVEFVEIRYAGKAAAFLRGFRALYLGLLMNIIIMGWVNLAMVKIITVMFPNLTFFGLKSLALPGFEFSAALLWVAVILIVVGIYSSLAGLWGISITDVIQFTLAMAGTVSLAVIAVNLPEIGGMSGLKQKLPEWVFHFTPSVGSTGTTAGGVLSMTLTAFIAYIGIQWWASWYPGAEPGGGGYVAQRMMSARDEKHSLLATLWFIIAHYAIRPWPWILVALVSLVLYPGLEAADKGAGYVMVMRDHLPSGLLGLLLASFLAAFMSTISTQLNWGTSYIVNDFYRRFYRRGQSERDYVRISRVTTIIVMLLSLLATSQMDQISRAWAIILEFSAGIGLVLILRWFWWRINAWSEIAAMIAPFLIYPFLAGRVVFPATLFYIVAWSTLVWVVVTFLTPPTDDETLKNFYRRVHPGGRLWRRIARQVPEVEGDRGYAHLFVDWIAGCLLVFFSLFGVGKLLLGETGTGFGFLLIAAAGGAVIGWHLTKTGWGKIIE